MNKLIMIEDTYNGYKNYIYLTEKTPIDLAKKLWNICHKFLECNTDEEIEQIEKDYNNCKIEIEKLDGLVFGDYDYDSVRLDEKLEKENISTFNFYALIVATSNFEDVLNSEMLGTKHLSIVKDKEQLFFIYRKEARRLFLDWFSLSTLTQNDFDSEEEYETFKNKTQKAYDKLSIEVDNSYFEMENLFFETNKLNNYTIKFDIFKCLN